MERGCYRYVIKKTTKDNPYIRAPKKVIIEALGIPERSLDYVLKDLQEEGSLIYSFKRGRGGGITLARSELSLYLLLK